MSKATGVPADHHEVLLEAYAADNDEHVDWPNRRREQAAWQREGARLFARFDASVISQGHVLQIHRIEGDHISRMDNRSPTKAVRLQRTRGRDCRR